MLRILALLFALGAGTGAQGQVAAPHAIDIPPWFSETLLDLREDVRDAAREGKRVMLYFGQDGCPYCRMLMQANFTQPAIVRKTRERFVAIALNIWGDREVTAIDGRTMREKDFANYARVQFTPTLLFLDERGAVALRLNGYYPPRRFEAALDYVAGGMERKVSFQDHLKSVAREEASAELHDERFFVKPPYDLRRKRGGKPLAIVVETPYCAGCDEMHREGFARPEVKAELAKFDVVRLALADGAQLVTPDGRRLAASDWLRELQVAYTPSIVFFDGPEEAFRIEAYVRPFHLAGAFAYVSSRAYSKQPSFQRYLQARTEAIRSRGGSVELWK